MYTIEIVDNSSSVVTCGPAGSSVSSYLNKNKRQFTYHIYNYVFMVY